MVAELKTLRNMQKKYDLMEVHNQKAAEEPPVEQPVAEPAQPVEQSE